MSDLGELRERLHLDLERVLGAAAIVELDAEALRLAVLDALEIHDAAVADGKVTAGWYVNPNDRRQVENQTMARAAAAMADRLRQLHRVPVADPEPFDPSLFEMGLE